MEINNIRKNLEDLEWELYTFSKDYNLEQKEEIIKHISILIKELKQFKHNLSQGRQKCGNCYNVINICDEICEYCFAEV